MPPMTELTFGLCKANRTMLSIVVGSRKEKVVSMDRILL